MKIAFAADPLASFKIEKDSTYAMMVEAARRGHALYSFGHADLIFDGRKVLAYLSRVRLTGNPQDWFHQDEPVLMSLNDVDAVIERTDPPFNMEYVYATYLLERAEADGARIFNRPGAIRSHNEKLAITGFTQFIAPTLVTSKEASIRDFHREHRDIILKPLDGMGGEGVFRVGEQGLNLGAIIETLTQHGARTIMVQRYIPEIVDGDRRVLLIGGQVVPYCLARVPQAGEVRGNLAAGGRGVAMPVSAREREIAETLAPVLYQRGLLLVGLDVIGNYLTEINVTSPTCFQEIAEQTGFDVAGMFIDALERTLAGG
ncbi:MAG: glutathione synthase [Pseudomonadota bacterium]|jgi:glutathione synthase|nr:glutathione synthase [Oxalobacteraceae bacterium]